MFLTLSHCFKSGYQRIAGHGRKPIHLYFQKCFEHFCVTGNFIIDFNWFWKSVSVHYSWTIPGHQRFFSTLHLLIGIFSLVELWIFQIYSNHKINTPACQKKIEVRRHWYFICIRLNLMWHFIIIFFSLHSSFPLFQTWFFCDLSLL